jgi:WD40 repeat protein
MSKPVDPATPGQSTLDAFPSVAAMRAAHNDLLQRRREAGITGTSTLAGRRSDPAVERLAAAAAEFIQRGQAAGVSIDDDDGRVAAQSLLTYWANLLQRIGHTVSDATLAEFDPDLAPELPDSACPYVGLDAFREGDHGRFFGRGALVAELTSRLAFERLMLVVGPSGSGKSSLVRAGIVPALRAGALPGSSGWRYLDPIVPGSEPLLALARTLRPGEPRSLALQTAAAIRRSPATALELLALDRPAALVVDQLEELFTLTEHEADRDAFVGALLALADTPVPGHVVLLTMRSDFEPFAAAMPQLAERLPHIRVPATPLSAPELREAIEAPAAGVGLRFESGVVDQLVQDIVGEPAGLPLLQFTLLKLWERRDRNRITTAAYDEVGGGRQALARSADAFYEGLIPEEQVTLKRLMLRLVRHGDGLEVTSSRVRLDSLYTLGEDPGRVERVVRKLIDARLLRLTPGDEQSPTQVEVAHEALVRNWPRLVGWLEEQKVALATRRRLELRAQEWLHLGGGKAGLLDEAQLREAERWLATPEATYLGYDQAVPRLIYASGEALREAEAEREAARERELEQARALAAEQRARAEAESARAEAEAARARAQAERAAAERRARDVLRVLSAMLAAAALAAMFLFVLAQRSEAEAQVARATSDSLAATSQVLRVTAEAGRDAEAIQRQTAEAAKEAEAAQRATAVAASLSARAGELAAQAQRALPVSPQLGLLLAAESVSATDSPEAVAVETLRGAVARTYGEGLGSHAGPINEAAAAPGPLVATADEDGAVTLWTPAPGVRLADLGGPARHVALSADGRWLAVAGETRLLLYELVNGTPAGAPAELAVASPVSVLGISPGGAGAPWLIAGGQGGEVRGWNLAGGPVQPVDFAGGGAGPVRALAFTPGGGGALTGGADRVVTLWDLRPTNQRSRLIGVLDARPGPISALAVSPDGRWMAAGGDDAQIHIWRLSGDSFAGGAPAVKTGHQGSIAALAFSPDSQWLLSGSTDRNARLWPAAGFGATGAEAVVLPGHTRAVTDSAFTADSQLAITGGADGALLVWRIAAPAEPPRQLLGHDRPVSAIMVDGATLLTAGEDGQLRRWTLPPEPLDAREAAVGAAPVDELRRQACAIAGRNLTDAEIDTYFGGDRGRPPTCP